MTDLTLSEAMQTPESIEPRVFRVGCISISEHLMEQQGITFDMTDAQASLRDQGIFSQIKAWLLLPENYTILALYYVYLRGEWHVIVDSPDLPDYETNTEVPQITPYYRKDRDGTVHLLKITMDERWQRTYSLEEVTLEQRER